MDLLDLGPTVRERRREQRLTRDALATRCGVSLARIEAFENGRALDMKFGNVVAILEGVGLTLSLAPTPDRRPVFEDLVTEEDPFAPRMD